MPDLAQLAFEFGKVVAGDAGIYLINIVGQCVNFEDERIEQHRDQPGCRQCHAKIDPWGVAFEQFDAGGRLKQQRVDAKSTLPDQTEVDGANDPKRYLAEDRIGQVAFSFLKHLTTYATGRTLTYSELAWLKQDSLKLKATGYRTRDMFRYVVDSKMFLEK